MTRRRTSRTDAWMKFIRNVTILAIVGAITLVVTFFWALIEITKIATQQ